MINTRAAGDSRFARTGKDGAIYNADGVLLATVDSFTANVTYNNAAYSVLGNAQELETANTFKVALTMSQVVVEDDAFIQELVEAMESQTMPVWDFQGVLKGRNGTEERMVELCGQQTTEITELTCTGLRNTVRFTGGCRDGILHLILTIFFERWRKKRYGRYNKKSKCTDCK